MNVDLYKGLGKHDELQYLDLIKEIMRNGDVVEGRNGNTKVIIGAMMKFSLKGGYIPILTTKKTAWKTCLKELLWFISGNTSNKTLKAQNVRIWNDNGSRDFLDSRGLTERAEDDLGPVYGFQWRHFDACYSTAETDYSGEGIDQLAKVVELLKNPETRSSRRIIMTAWNPKQLDEMALPPCHLLCQFNVTGPELNRLSCCLYQRSGDVGLGVPFNIASYSFLTYMLADLCGLVPDQFVHFISNAHIYDDHFEGLAEQATRVPKAFPKLKIRENNYASIDEYKLDDFVVEGYEHHEEIKLKMRK
jgi:thymidylate synthase